MEVKRRNFQGVLNILSFNRHFYVIGLASLALLLILFSIADWPLVLSWIVMMAFAYGLIMPLVVSAYVYDFSGYYEFNWLRTVVSEGDKANLIVNINAGFDETSFIINSKFPKCDLRVYDFYDSKRHTEPAIVRARKVSLVYPNTQQIASNHIPLEDSSADIIFLLSAIHEIRSDAEKVQFLKECYRVCKSTGRVIMVEHLRDLPNFLAFTVGFSHFFSRSVWKEALSARGFHLFEKPNSLHLCPSSTVPDNGNST